MKFNFELSVRRALPTCGELQASFAVFFTYAGCDSPSLPDWRVHMRPVVSHTGISCACRHCVRPNHFEGYWHKRPPEIAAGAVSCPLVTDLGTLVLLII
jgi:hypothetical protein